MAVLDGLNQLLQRTEPLGCNIVRQEGRALVAH